MKSIYLIVFGLAIACTQVAAQRKLVCYYASWSIYVPSLGAFKPSDINATLCTHIMYAFIGTDANANVVIGDPWADITQGGFVNINNLKSQNPNLKTLFSLGGGTADSSVFSAVVGNPTLRAKLVQNLYNFTVKYNYNGIDVDWEYPAQNGGVPADKANYALLLKEMSAKFKPNGLLVTAALSAYIPFVATSYDITALNNYLDLILLMNYDYYGSWSPVTGPTAPLYAASTDADKTLNVNGTIQYWIKAGALKSKLVMGIPLYGCSFTLKSTTSTGVGAAITGTGTAGPYTQTAGTLHYNEICEKIKAGGWTVVMHAQQKVPYAYKGNQWVGYDNPTSVQTKANYIKTNLLAGSMVWVLHGDDFRNTCGGGKYPLITMLKNTQG